MLSSTVAVFHDNTAHGEDHYLVQTLGPCIWLDAVMDGVSGRSGREASQAVGQALAAASPTSPEAVVAVLEDMNRRCFQVSLGRSFLTTASVALSIEGVVHVVSVGDSPVLLIRPHTTQLLSSPVRGVMQAGRARALGIQPTLRPLSRTAVAIAPGDRLVLLSDGITDNVTHDELGAMVRCAAAPEQAVAQFQTLLAARRLRGCVPEQLGGHFYHDDQTAVVRFFRTTA